MYTCTYMFTVVYVYELVYICVCVTMGFDDVLVTPFVVWCIFAQRLEDSNRTLEEEKKKRVQKLDDTMVLAETLEERLVSEVGAAQSQIDTLLEENRGLSQELERLRAERAELQERIVDVCCAHVIDFVVTWG